MAIDNCWNRYCVSLRSLVHTVILFSNSWMKSLACMSQAPPVSMATGTKLFVTAMLEYFKVLSEAAWFAAVPASIEVLPTWERAKVSATVTSHASAFSLAHGMSVAPSGLLPSARERPTGSLTAGICALLTALHMMSFRCAWKLLLLFLLFILFLFFCACQHEACRLRN